MCDFDLYDEFVGCDFGDARLSKRVLKMADVFENNPGRSIPSAFATRADWEACYRFFDNQTVTPSYLKPEFFRELSNFG
ncbi:MAG TPA: transposase [Pirellula sp.]|nr:transposase [Pirellula sp.]